MDFKTYISRNKDEQLAVEDICRQIAKENLVAIVCYYTQGYGAEKLRLAFNKIFPSVSIIGCSTCKGVMTERGLHFGEVIGVFAIHDSKSTAYGSGIASLDDVNDIDSAVKGVIESTLLKAERQGEVPSFAIINSTPGLEEKLIKSFDNFFATPIPIIGATAADNGIKGQWSLFNEDGSTSKGFTIQLLFPSRTVATGFSAGYTPTQFTGTVTKSNGREALEIDSVPAQEKYLEWIAAQTNKKIPKSFKFQLVTQYPLGRQAGQLYGHPYFKLSHPIKATSNGGMLFFTDLVEGDGVTLMIGDRSQLIARPARVIKEARRHSTKDSKLRGAVCIICAGAMLHLENDMENVYQQIVKEMQGIPFICPFTFGEQGRFINGDNGHGNLMISAATFYSD